MKSKAVYVAVAVNTMPWWHMAVLLLLLVATMAQLKSPYKLALPAHL